MFPEGITYEGTEPVSTATWFSLFLFHRCLYIFVFNIALFFGKLLQIAVVDGFFLKNIFGVNYQKKIVVLADISVYRMNNFVETCLRIYFL